MRLLGSLRTQTPQEEAQTDDQGSSRAFSRERDESSDFHVDMLPEGIIRDSLDYLSTVDLSRAAVTHVEWRKIVREVARLKVARKRELCEPRLLIGPEWIMVLGSTDKLERMVGARPARSWRDEWSAIRFEVELQHGTLDWLAMCDPLEALHRGGLDGVRESVDRVFGAGAGEVLIRAQNDFYSLGGPGSIQTALDPASSPVAEQAAAWKIAAGWPVETAQAWTLLMMYATSALGRVVRVAAETGVPCVFGASIWRLVDSFANIARREEYREPREAYCYKHLVGPQNPSPGVGLKDHDACWAALLGENVEPGVSFVTTAPLEASAKAACLSEEGYCTPMATQIGVNYAFVGESDIVRFANRAPDSRGFHSLLTSVDNHIESEYDLPPLATITLETIHEKGTWSAFGFTGIDCRLFTVGVTFVC